MALLSWAISPRIRASSVTTGASQKPHYGKPVVLAEFGYSGDRAYVEKWAADSFKLDPKFPLLKAIVYFDDKEVTEWPFNYGRPNWRVTMNVIGGSLSD